MQGLREVYGCEVLPNSMLQLRRRLSGIEGCAALMDALCPLLLRPDESPW